MPVHPYKKASDDTQKKYYDKWPKATSYGPMKGDLISKKKEASVLRRFQSGADSTGTRSWDTGRKGA